MPDAGYPPKLYFYPMVELIGILVLFAIECLILLITYFLIVLSWLVLLSFGWLDAIYLGKTDLGEKTFVGLHPS